MSVRRIARILKISPAAVSLALAGSPKISAPTRAKVIRAANRLNYRPSSKVAELMTQVRASREGRFEGTLGVISLYDQPRPWESSEHFKRIHASMQKRARELGYGLESLWLKEPRMTHKRFRAIVEARGIQGLLCLGSPVLDDVFPGGFDQTAIVTVGLSIQTPLHRVTGHFYNDTTFLLNKLHAMGYRRPGLVISRAEEVRTAYARGAYLGWFERKLAGQNPLPVLCLDWKSDKPLASWMRRHRPDVLVVVLLANAVPELAEMLKRCNFSIPRDVGVAVMTHFLEGTGFSGLQQNQALVGAWAVEQVVSRIINRDYGVPEHARIETVEGCWVDGASL